MVIPLLMLAIRRYRKAQPARAPGPRIEHMTYGDSHPHPAMLSAA